MLNQYEAIFIIKTNEDENKIKETIEKINNIISEESTILDNIEKGERNLAYPIKGERSGYFYFVVFKQDDSKKNVVGKISVKINTLEEVLKHIFIRVDDSDG